MSRGPGHIQRAIEAVFAAEPDNAFTTEDLCDRIYHGNNRVERKHRVAVLRAAKNVCTRSDSWQCWRGEKLGNPVVFLNPYNVMSYAMARSKSEDHYRSNDTRLPDHWRSKNEADIRADLAEGGRHHHLVVEGGAWWRHAHQRIADRDNDTERAKELDLQSQEALARLRASFR